MSEAVLKMINKRIDELALDLSSLAKSFETLNESHHVLELSFARMETEWKITGSWVRFLFGTSLLGFVISLLTVLKIFGVV